jgi:hypothetical protein
VGCQVQLFNVGMSIVATVEAVNTHTLSSIINNCWALL